ncbi:MAG TPA: hypothetical protein V6D17_11585 [Candidatus Obscuribacterales bacterium]
MLAQTIRFYRGIRSAFAAGLSAFSVAQSRRASAAAELSQRTPCPYDGLREYASINPHLIVNPLRQGSAESVASAVGRISRQEQLLACLHAVRDGYARACEKLLASPRVAARFPGAIPLAYALYPQLEAMDEDDLGAQKFGGIPDIRHAYWINNISEKETGSWVKEPSFEQRFAALVENWPYCGACHKPMTFIAQMDLSDWGMAIHALTSSGQQEKGDRWLSGIGWTRHFGSSAHRGWWYLFACRDNHFDNPNADAHVWLESRAIPFKITINGVDFGSDDEQRLDDVTAKELVERFYQATQTRTFSIEGRQIFESRQQTDFAPTPAHEDHFALEPMRIVGFAIGWEFDFGVGDVDWDLRQEIDDIIEQNPQIFGSQSQFKLFGAPVSQQEQRRYWTVRGTARSGSALRMAPLLGFHDSNHDVTYQIYADMLGDFYGCNLYGKVDASCT